MLGRSLSLAAAAAFSLMAPAVASAPIVIEAPTRSVPLAIKSTRAHRLRTDHRDHDRRARQGRTYGRGDKLARRLRRKVELGRNGAF